MSYLKQTQDTDNFLAVLVKDHQRYMPIMKYLDNLTLQESELTWQERELISLEVSKANGAQFCMAIHQGLLNAADNSDQVVRSQRLEPALRLARLLAKSSSTVTQEDIDNVRNAGWSDQTIEDIIGLASAITVYDILANGFGFGADLSESTFEEMGRGTIQQGGFEAQFRSFIQ